MNKWSKTKKAEKESLDKSPGKISADAVLLGEGFLSFQVLLFDKYEETPDKENKKDTGA